MKTISIVALSFRNKETHLVPDGEALSALIKSALQGGEDLVLLPENCMGNDSYTLEDPLVEGVRALAAQESVHILLPFVHQLEDGSQSTCALLIGRKGETLFCYHKAFPYWDELAGDRLHIGGAGAVADTDFGRVGVAICFDANFPELWRELEERDAQLVLFTSAYSAGRQLAAHAMNHHYQIVTCTRFPDVAAYDMAGEEIFYQSGDRGELLISRLALDLDRVICHHNFNQDKVAQLLERHPNEIIVQDFPREQWLVLSSASPNTHVGTLCRQFGIEPLRDYKRRSRRHIDQRRGYPLHRSCTAEGGSHESEG